MCWVAPYLLTRWCQEVRCRSAEQVRPGKLDDLVAAAIDDGAGEIDAEPFCLFHCGLGRQGEFLPVGHHIDECRAIMGEGLAQGPFELGRILDPEALDAGCLRYGGEVRVLELNAGFQEA